MRRNSGPFLGNIAVASIAILIVCATSSFGQVPSLDFYPVPNSRVFLCLDRETFDEEETLALLQDKVSEKDFSIDLFEGETTSIVGGQSLVYIGTVHDVLVNPCIKDDPRFHEKAAFLIENIEREGNTMYDPILGESIKIDPIGRAGYVYDSGSTYAAFIGICEYESVGCVEILLNDAMNIEP